MVQFGLVLYGNIGMKIFNRDCGKSSLVRDFATFHIFFDLEHIPEQVCRRDAKSNLKRTDANLAPKDKLKYCVKYAQF